MDKEELCFLKERKLIGKGRIADVYLWKGFVYKCFKEGYPVDWIQYEFDVQQEIVKTKLPVIHFYPSEFPNSIKMDYIDGEEMVEEMKRDRTNPIYLEQFMKLFQKIHSYHGLNLVKLKESMPVDIGKVNIEERRKKLALQYFDEFPDQDTLCHLDFHFLNVLFEKKHSQYYIIDWITAKIGNPIFDYARTYVICYEYVRSYSSIYLEQVNKLCGYKKEELSKAIYIMAIQRLNEFESKDVRELIDEMEQVLVTKIK
ncbi:MAG: phosphotransferase [bacterium]|nr:phosphotransferase [bacterium]